MAAQDPSCRERRALRTAIACLIAAIGLPDLQAADRSGDSSTNPAALDQITPSRDAVVLLVTGDELSLAWKRFALPGAGAIVDRTVVSSGRASPSNTLLQPPEAGVGGVFVLGVGRKLLGKCH